MHILNVSTKQPSYIYSQEELTEALARVWQLNAGDSTYALLKKFARSSGVSQRAMSMSLDDYTSKASFTDRSEVYLDVGYKLASEAVAEICRVSEMDLQEVDAIFFTTVTGVSVPSIDALLANRMPFQKHVKRVPMFGLGCVAGAAGTARVFDYLKAWPTHSALLVSLELCSLTFQMGDRSVSNMVGVNLFGDGAAALLAVGYGHRLSSKSRAKVLGSRSTFYPGTESLMGWDVGSHGFRLQLEANVPDLVRKYFRQDVDDFLESENLSRSAIKHWIAHPGGPKILNALRDVLELSDEDVALARQGLATRGNMSSASVLYTLKDVLDAGLTGHALMTAMGPGFCSEKVLLGGVA
jgi:alkylresorcinol/alkylpyrone synthase